MSREEGDGAGSSVESLFADWLASAERSAEEFEELCRAHPEGAARLRELWRDYDRLEALRPRLGLEDTLAARLALRFGPEVDPRVELEREDSPDFPARVVGRLAERGPLSARYRLKGTVAEGGMGAILRVWDEDLRRQLAMKVILGRRDAPSDATPPVDRRQLARFLEEAQVTGQLDHPGIVPVHELGIDERGRAYFTMKLVKGRDLKTVFELVREGAEGWNQVKALGVLLKVCEAMSYAHDKGVIHRDLKPANVMVGRYGEVYVMDWGLARILGRADEKDIRLRAPDSTGLSAVRSDRREAASDTPDSPLCTMDGDVVGTPAYMPPEQANGELDAMGPHSDVYAVGAMIYHLVAGHMPYVRPGERASNYSVLRWLRDGPPHPLLTEAPNAPVELVAIADKAMERDPRRRYPDMTALARDLAAYETGALAEAKKWVRRNKALATSLAAAVLILVAGVATSLVFARNASERADENARLRDKALEGERELRVRGLIQELAALDAASQDLDYALRQSEPSHLWWPRWARRLLEGQEEDRDRDIPWRPGLAEAERRLAELRSRADPYTPEDALKDRTTHPRLEELEHKRAEHLWHRRMLGLEAWPELEGADAELKPYQLAAGALSLNRWAWQRVGPDAQVHGEERRALLLAQGAWEQVREIRWTSPDIVQLASAASVVLPSLPYAQILAAWSRATSMRTLAWAQYRCGRLDAARATMARALEGSTHAGREQLESHLRRLEEAIAPWRDGSAEATVASLVSEVTALEATVAERRTWRFAQSDDEWWHKHVSALIGDLHRLRERLAFVERSVETSEAVELWRKASAAIAVHPKYGGLKLAPQIGLLPIGPDPVSELWEFAHLQSGEPPRRDAEGKLVLTEKTGLVFVLLPGGRFWMGAQRTDPAGRHYDPQAQDSESPVHEVELSPFFLSKYEMAQGPWRRIALWSSPYWGEDLLQPANSVSWDDCMAALARADAWITLCTETQWEYACRGGTSWPWWTGPDAKSLRGKENVGLDGQSSSLQPIGRYAPNPFGLHDMHGNLWEWCLDGAYREYPVALVKDPLHPWEGAGIRVIRGGFHWFVPATARSSLRYAGAPDIRFDGYGLRPARRITP